MNFRMVVPKFSQIVLFALVLAGLLMLASVSRAGKWATSARAATQADAVTFECFNGHVFFSSKSTNAPDLNSDSCAQVTADLINQGFVLQAHNTVNFGAVFVYVRGTGFQRVFGQD